MFDEESESKWGNKDKNNIDKVIIIELEADQAYRGDNPKANEQNVVNERRDDVQPRKLNRERKLPHRRNDFEVFPNLAINEKGELMQLVLMVEVELVALDTTLTSTH